MKKIILFVIVFAYLHNCFGQDTVERRNHLSDSVLERFFVLKLDKKTKNGLYRALFKRKTAVAEGNYRLDKKVGTWDFYKPNGLLVQTFNYDSNSLIYESALDTLYDVRYFVDRKIKDTDILTRPVKIGGIYYGLIPYLNAFQPPFETADVNTDRFDATIELLISPLGKLADYTVHLFSPLYQYDRTFHLDVHLFDEADRNFIPSTINGEPILSRIMIRCFVEKNGSLDFD